MPYDPDKHHRRSIRLPGFDYSKAGAYFVTLVAQDRACRFGEIQDGTMRLNSVGEIFDTIWREIPVNYAGVEIDYHVVMPNHLHGILVLGGIPSPTIGGPSLSAPPTLPFPEDGDASSGLSVSEIVGRFKSLTTNRYIEGVKENGWPRFRGHFWQRNYHEHVIRDEEDWGRIAEYVLENPAKWADDPENPLSSGR